MGKRKAGRIAAWILALLMCLSVFDGPVAVMAESAGSQAGTASDTAAAQDSGSTQGAGEAGDAGSGTGTDTGATNSTDGSSSSQEAGKSSTDTDAAGGSQTDAQDSQTQDSSEGSEDTAADTSEDSEAEEGSVSSYSDFLTDLTQLETYAASYVSEHSGEDADALIINYIRTGVERYTTSAWMTFCGEENTSFVSYVAQQDQENSTQASSLRNIEVFTLPNGDTVDFGHMFGCMDMYYHTKNQDTGDLGSWAGDLCDLLWLVQTTGIDTSKTVDEMADLIRTDSSKYFLHTADASLADEVHSFTQTDLYGDLDAYYILQNMGSSSSLSSLFQNYFTANLTDKIRVRYFLEHRFSGKTTKDEIRQAVSDTYSANEGIKTLEGSYLSSGVNADIRTACCYAFADYLYYTLHEEGETSYYSVFSSESSTLAPGIVQTKKKATTTDGKQIAYYLATADITRSDVHIYANYKDNDASGWGMQRVSEQMQAAQKKHSDASDAASYIENYNVVAGINADFYNMSNGVPAGALVMGGTQYHGAGDENFFAILKDGSAMIGSSSDWDSCKDNIQEAVGGATWLVKDGKIAVTPSDTYTSNRVSRTCIGITYDGKVVMMVLDGRQEPYSAGGSPEEIAQIMLDAGCVSAINLDGGGSSTFASKAEGADSISVVNSPSDGYERSVSSSLMVVSTAKPSNVFDHAVLSADYDYLTVGTSLSVKAAGATATGGSIALPEGTSWKLSDETLGSVSDDGVFTASALGDEKIQLVSSDGTVLGSKTVHVVEPTGLKFTKDSLSTVYGASSELPLEATYNGNSVKINSKDVTFGYLKQSLTSIGTVDGKEVNTTKTELVYDYPEAGSIQDFAFTPAAGSSLRTLTIGAVLTCKLSEFSDTVNSEYLKAYQESIAAGQSESAAAVTAQTSAINKALDTAAKITVYMYQPNEAEFDFNTADGKDSSGLLAWKRSVDDSTYDPDEARYILQSRDAAGTANYTFAVDMSKVPIPDKLSGLLYMLPGGDQKGKTAWDFMLQLAERISPLTTVTVEITIPDGFTVDTSNLKLVNDFFRLDSAMVDGNKLTIKMGFVTQSEPVNPATANPICVLSGLKLTPDSDASWSDDGFLSCNLSGTASYDIYAHFHVLKSLASQTEYQEKYGLYPYDNSGNQAGDYGAHFPNEVAAFNDSFELQKDLKQGWEYEDGVWKYYDENGKALTGVQELPSFTNGESGTFWYGLGTDGSCTEKLTGIFEKDGSYYYSRAGELVTGWQSIEDKDSGKSYYYYFDPVSHKAATGETEINGLDYTFDGTGKLVRGAFYSDGTGTRYNVAGRDLWRQFVTLSEGTYWIDAQQHVAYGNAHTVTTNVKDVTWYHFDETTGLMTGVCSGIFTYQGSLYYADSKGKTFYGLIQTDKGIVFSGTLGKLAVNEGVYVDSTTGQDGCSLGSGWYYAGPDGYLAKDGFATVNGNTYHYSNYAIAKGFQKIGEDYYIFNAGNGRMYKDASMWVGDNSYGIGAGIHEFGPDGKMYLLSGFVNETHKDGKTYTYYYKKGEKLKGLQKIGDDYYFFNKSSGMLYKDATMWIAGENSYGFAGGMYYFDEEGRMQQKSGFVTETHKDGKAYTYYYQNGKKLKGLQKIGDDYYFFNKSSGMMYADATMWVAGENDYGFAGGMYYFDKEGKMKQP